MRIWIGSRIHERNSRDHRAPVQGAEVAVDGDEGLLYLEPDTLVVERYEGIRELQRKRKSTAAPGNR